MTSHIPSHDRPRKCARFSTRALSVGSLGLAAATSIAVVAPNLAVGQVFQPPYYSTDCAVRQAVGDFHDGPTRKNLTNGFSDQIQADFSCSHHASEGWVSGVIEVGPDTGRASAVLYTPHTLGYLRLGPIPGHTLADWNYSAFDACNLSVNNGHRHNLACQSGNSLAS